MKLTKLKSVAIQPDLIRVSVLCEHESSVTQHDVAINCNDFCSFEGSDVQMNMDALKQSITDKIAPALVTGFISNVISEQALSWPVTLREQPESDTKLAYGEETSEISSEVSTSTEL
jgi:hypothetical protein